MAQRWEGTGRDGTGRDVRVPKCCSGRGRRLEPLPPPRPTPQAFKQTLFGQQKVAKFKEIAANLVDAPPASQNGKRSVEAICGCSDVIAYENMDIFMATDGHTDSCTHTDM